jgi:hypothetical protein
MDATPVQTIEDAEYARLLAGLKTGALSALVTTDVPRLEGFSTDGVTLAPGSRYVVWGRAGRTLPPIMSNLGHFSEVRIIDGKRAAELIAAGAIGPRG